MNEEKSLFEQLTEGMPGGVSDAPEEETEEQEEAAPEGEESEEAEEGVEGEEEAEGEEGGEEEADAEEEAEEGDEGGEVDEDAAAKAKAAAKPVDPINDPLPKGTLQQTQERFRKIVDIVKEKDAKITALEARAAEGDELMETITSTGMDGDKFGVLLEYARGVNSGSPEGMESAFNIIKGEYMALAKALGEPVIGVNPLEGHADLIQLINEKKIDPAIAVETAMNRNRAAARQKLREAQGSETQRAAQHQRAVASGRQALTALGKQLTAKDGQTEYLRKAKLAAEMLQETMGSIPPHQWARAFRAIYDKIPAAPKAPPKPAKKKVGNQPLRGNKRPSGNGTQKAPKSLADVVRFAVGQNHD